MLIVTQDVAKEIVRRLRSTHGVMYASSLPDTVTFPPIGTDDYAKYENYFRPDSLGNYVGVTMDDMMASGLIKKTADDHCGHRTYELDVKSLFKISMGAAVDSRVTNQKTQDSVIR